MGERDGDEEEKGSVSRVGETSPTIRKGTSGAKGSELLRQKTPPRGRPLKIE